jgi:Contractile injection system tube protein
VVNTNSLTQLKTAKKTASVPAYLQIKGTAKGNYFFNYNPESYTDKLAANYSPVAAASSSVPYLDFSNNSNITRTFSGLLMDTYSDGLSLRVILDGLKNLMIAHPDKGEFEPPDLEFHWGSESFKPCKLVDMSYTIDLWLGGEPAYGTVDLTFTLVPDSDPAKIQSTAVKAQTVLQAAIASNSTTIFTLPPNLTNRQKTEGALIALADIKTNNSAVSPSVKNAVKSNRFDIKLSADGVAILYDKNGKELLNIGIYDGIKFISNLVKKRNATGYN